MGNNKKIHTHKDLAVYQNAFTVALQIYTASQGFPKTEQYSLTDQMRRSSRSVAANIAEGFRKRRYQKAFIAKLSDAEGEAAETQVWLDFAYAHKYLPAEEYQKLYRNYDKILGQIVTMINNPNKWIL